MPVTRENIKENAKENMSSVIQEKFVFSCDHLLNFCTNFERNGMDDQTDSVLEAKMNDLEVRWMKLQNAYEDLMISQEKGNAKDYKENARVNFNACSEAYYTCRSQLVDLLKLGRECDQQNTAPRASTQPQISTPGRTSFIRLPQCDIEVFNGNYEEWPAFRDLFTTACIENDDIPRAQKLFYLRLKTSGSAGAIVKRYNLCDQNFEPAWNALKARFENKRLLVDNRLKSLFNIPVAISENSESIQRIHSTVTECLTALRALGMKVDGWDPILIYLVSTKLPDDTLALWEQSFKTQRELPTWAQMDEFLVNRYEVVERISSIRTTKECFTAANPHQTNTQSYSSQGKVNSNCPLCNGEHTLRACIKFRKYPVQQRMDYVFRNKICNNCLSSGHLRAKCSSKKLCLICKSDHHTLLHMHRPREQSDPEQNRETPESSNKFQNYGKRQTHSEQSTGFDQPSTSRNSQVQANFSANSEHILLRTALVQLELRGELFTVRALIDPGSQRTFVSERLRNLLRIPYKSTQMEIVGIGGQTQTATRECTITIVAVRGNVRFDVKAIILPKVTKQIPSLSFSPPESEQLKSLELADPHFNTSSPIDLILGNDSEHFINLEGIKKNICGQATAYNTVFGWVLSGPIQSTSIHAFTTSVVSSET